MAKLKAEVTHAHHQEHGAALRDKLFANVDTLFALGSRIAPVANLLSSLPGSGVLMEKTMGIARERSLPELRGETFIDWFGARESPINEDEAARSVVLFPDAYTNHVHPEVGKAAVEVLEAAGVYVTLLDGHTDSGRPAYSKGLLDDARSTAVEVIAACKPHVDADRDIVFVEPSDAVMVQSDYLDLLGSSDDRATTVAAHTYGVCEYIDTFDLDREVHWESPAASLAYHGHCHQKAMKKDHHAVGVLRRAGYDVDPLDSGCCGMAGSFGYEAEHYSMSQAIGEILFEQVEEAPAEQVVAPGASCRTQLGDREGGDEPPHPIEALADALTPS